MNRSLRTSTTKFHSQPEHRIHTLREELHQLFEVQDVQAIAPLSSEEAGRFEFTVRVE